MNFRGRIGYDYPYNDEGEEEGEKDNSYRGD
jgi:hypothetical protein